MPKTPPGPTKHRPGKAGKTGVQNRTQFGARTAPKQPPQSGMTARVHVKAWRPKQLSSSRALCRLIERESDVQTWPVTPAEPIYRNRYLVMGEHTYWAIGPLETATRSTRKP